MRWGVGDAPPCVTPPMSHGDSRPPVDAGVRVQVWSSDPAIANPLLKLLAEMCFNRGSRMAFGAASANGIHLFRQASAAIASVAKRPPPLAAVRPTRTLLHSPRARSLKARLEPPAASRHLTPSTPRAGPQPALLVPVQDGQHCAGAAGQVPGRRVRELWRVPPVRRPRPRQRPGFHLQAHAAHPRGGHHGEEVGREDGCDTWRTAPPSLPPTPITPIAMPVRSGCPRCTWRT